MKTVIVASTNPVKVQAARLGFSRMFPNEVFAYEGLSVPSGVSDQPMSSEETLRGAANRARKAQEAAPDANFWVGIEGGVEAVGVEAVEGNLAAPDLCAFAWVVVLSADQTGRGRTGVFFLPPRVAELVRQGKELGEADDIVFGRTNSKQENGAVGLLTGNVVDRAGYYKQAVILALIPFKNRALYPAGRLAE